MSLILAGDVGGTKTLLELGTLHEGHWRPVFSSRYAAVDYPDLPGVLRTFLQQWQGVMHPRPQDVLTAACFGVAGPALDDRVQMTNLPWIIDGPALSAEFGIPRLKVVNDFAAAAAGVELLGDADLVVLQAGEPIRSAPRVVIGAGTGLGVAYLIPAEPGYTVIAGESGHTGFAPATSEQAELWRGLHSRLGRVSTEDIVSGTGLVRIHEFIARTAGGAVAPEIRYFQESTAVSTAVIKLGDIVSFDTVVSSASFRIRRASAHDTLQSTSPPYRKVGRADSSGAVVW